MIRASARPLLTAGLLVTGLLLWSTPAHTSPAQEAASGRTAYSNTVKKQGSPSSSSSSRTGSDEAAIRAALARRAAWSNPRQAVIQPSQPGADTDSSEFILAQATPGPNDDLVREALRNRGQPYVWGGASRGGFDCSGFVCYIFAKQRGIKLPHSASAQARLGRPVTKEELQAGDLVFFSTYRAGISHVGIYIGNGKFIHAANSRKDVRIDTLNTGYYARRLKAARRLVEAPLELPQQELRGLEREVSEIPGTQEP